MFRGGDENDNEQACLLYNAWKSRKDLERGRHASIGCQIIQTLF